MNVVMRQSCRNYIDIEYRMPRRIDITGNRLFKYFKHLILYKIHYTLQNCFELGQYIRETMVVFRYCANKIPKSFP